MTKGDYCQISDIPELGIEIDEATLSNLSSSSEQLVA